MDFHKLTVRSITPETADTSTLEFEIPEELQDQFEYTQGQYVTIRWRTAGRELRRSYSMSSSPLEKRLAVTVKKVPGGQVSTYLHEEVKVGDALYVAPQMAVFSTNSIPKNAAPTTCLRPAAASPPYSPSCARYSNRSR